MSENLFGIFYKQNTQRSPKKRVKHIRKHFLALGDKEKGLGDRKLDFDQMILSSMLNHKNMFHAEYNR